MLYMRDFTLWKRSTELILVFEIDYRETAEYYNTRTPSPFAHGGFCPATNLLRYHVILTWQNALGDGDPINDPSAGSGRTTLRPISLFRFPLVPIYERCRNTRSFARGTEEVICCELGLEIA